MSHSKGTWIYDAESGAVYTKDRTGYWGPDHYPVEVCAVAALDGVNNGPLLAAAPELLEALIDALALIELVMPIEGDVTRNARKAIAKAGGKQ